MSEKGKKWFAAFTLLAFVVFYCGNTCFIHPHMVNGHLVAHSHPYLPGSTHSHSSVSLESISVFNGIAASMLDTAQKPLLPTPVCSRINRVLKTCISHCYSYRTVANRAPPAA